jgi:hypothetical protein
VGPLERFRKRDAGVGLELVFDDDRNEPEEDEELWLCAEWIWLEVPPVDVLGTVLSGIARPEMIAARTATPTRVRSKDFLDLPAFNAFPD